MSEIITSALLANGLRTEFADTYLKVRNRQADSRIAKVMDLGVKATNRRHEFGYLNAAPHIERWIRGEAIPEDAMDSVQFSATVHNWGRRVKWHKDDRKDEQTGTLMDAARGAGESAALLPERMFFDLLAGTTNTLPAVPNAPDGAAFFSATGPGSADRFGVSGGNLITGGGITTSALILTDFYLALQQFMLFQDGKGQPLLSPEAIAAGTIVIHAAADTEEFETAFLQKRQGRVMGTDAGVTPSNIVIDSSRNVELWGSPRIATGDWFVFLKNSPKPPTFLLDREGLLEQQSLEGDSNGDLTRTTGIEYIQWELRQGAGVALPYGAIKVNN